LFNTILAFLSENTLIIITLSVFISLFLHQNLKISFQKKELLKMHKELKNLETTISVFEDGSQGVGRRLLSAENQLQSLLSDQLKIKDKLIVKSFSDASNLVSKGFSRDEVFSASDLTKSEVDLLFLLNEKKQ
tara:strand:- start:402 stop:800 length:399 start_codon:yes stop_codon:yes gene_type:complete